MSNIIENANEHQILGESIRQKRKMKSLSLQDLAKQLGVSAQQMQKYETGKNKVSAVRLKEIESVLGEISKGYSRKESYYDSLNDSAEAHEFSYGSKKSEALYLIDKLSPKQQESLIEFLKCITPL